MKNPQKIAYLCHVYPWITQTFIFNEIKELKANLDSLQVIAFKQPSPADRSKLTPEMRASLRDTVYLPTVLSHDSLHSCLFSFSHYPDLFLSIFFQVLFGRYQRFSTAKLRFQSVQDFLRGIFLGKFLQENDFSHVHAEFANHTATSAWVAHNLTGISFSFRNHTCYNPQIISRKVRDAKFVLSISEFDRQQLLSWSEGAEAHKVFVDYLGVDVERWQGDDRNVEEQGLILSIGTLIEKKGHKYLITACHLLKNNRIPFRTIIVGEGPEHARLRDLTNRLRLNEGVEIRNYCTNDEVRKLVHQASIFCLPSVTSKDGDSDGIPIVLMEAMAAAKACVSTSVAGIPELITHGENGFLAEPRDSSGLAEILGSLLEDGHLRQKLGASARSSIVERFNLKRNVARTARYFLDDTCGGFFS